MRHFKEKIARKYKDFLIDNQLKNHNYIKAAYRARKWISKNTIQNKGIVITSKQRTIYQEVTGYYIPTLLQWGMREEALNYTHYLCSIQEESGAWLDGTQQRESVFNTGQVLRGLVAMIEIAPEIRENLIKGCDWLISNIDDNGRLVSTPGTVWPKSGINSELIHLYCLPPLRDAGIILGKKEYLDAVERVKSFYISQYMNDIENFNYLSHFYAYVLEALVDLGETELAVKAMKKIEKIQRLDGSVPAYKDCTWVCSTGLFQLAIVWFKLGNWDKGDRAFDYAVSLQNASGGWYGGYGSKIRLHNKTVKLHLSKETVSYFPDEEISWAVKYFFDALYYRENVEFESKASSFMDYISSDDGKFRVIYEQIQEESKEKDRALDVLDVGCGKGRYLKKLYLKDPSNNYCGVDISHNVLKYLNNKNIKRGISSILCINYPDNTLDVVFATESLEHAIFIDLAIKEMCRVLKPGGKLIIIDKDNDTFEEKRYVSWLDPKELSSKQWLDTKRTLQILSKVGLTELQTFFIPTGEGNMYRAFIGRKTI